MPSQEQPRSLPLAAPSQDASKEMSQPKKLPRMFLMAASPCRPTSAVAKSHHKSGNAITQADSTESQSDRQSESARVKSIIGKIPTPSRSRQLSSTTVKAEAADLPPVVSVRKMGSKGCAIVILRDQAVMELSVAMKVAVVDGICIEVRRHTASKEFEAAQPLGVFCAWGLRVERRMPVSEEGLEAYFNGLSRATSPQGLHPEAPFTETLQFFELSSQKPLAMDNDVKSDSVNASQVLDGPHARPDLVRSLWDAKQQLDDMWAKPPPPMGRSLMQRVAREQLFPHSGKEGAEHENRAGEKLDELAAAVGLLDGVPKNSAFLDLCGGPGSWSQFLLERSELALRGFGLTLRSNSGDSADWKSQEKDDWYPDLVQSRNWSPLWGKDGTGDLLKPTNLEHSTQELRDQGGVFLCVADGGFNDKAIPPNLLELYFYRLFLAELLTATSCLQPGGRFVCKLYTAFSTATSSLLFLTTRLFDKVAIVKPMTSRVAGPERYLYASGFREGAETAEIRAALSHSQAFGAGASPLQTPLLTPIVSATELAKDARFLEQLQAMVSTLCMRQAGAVKAIVDRANHLEEMALDKAEEAAENAPYWEAAAATQRQIDMAERAAQRAAKAEQWNNEDIRPTTLNHVDHVASKAKALTGHRIHETSLRPHRGN